MSGSTTTTIARRLTLLDARSGDRRTVSQTDLPGIEGPFVVLGDPGMGKSVLMADLGAVQGNRYVRAGTFVRSRRPEDLLPGAGGLLVIDGLDEVGAASPGDGIDAVLSQLSALGNPPFALSSREADWRGAADRIRLEDDYGRWATVLHLQPFNYEDATAFLGANFPDVDAAEILAHFANTGLGEIHGNPLTLRMIGEVGSSGEELPRTRSELLEQACRLMLVEDNPRHQEGSHARLPQRELLNAAGAACASLLLCDRLSVFTGPLSRSRSDDLPVDEIERLPGAAAVAAALRTRLFQADGEHRLLPVHRVLAEHLGGRWIAAAYAAGASERRIRAMMTLGGGVPTSIRGLNAWTAHFSQPLAPGCIRADPYAVLRYGDADTLPLDQASLLLDALATLSAEDPYFRAEDWGTHPASSLVRVELKDRILDLLAHADDHPHLCSMLLEAMPGSALARALAPDLMRLALDTKQIRRVRSLAAGALVSAGELKDPSRLVERLLEKGDHDSAEAAYEVVATAGGANISAALVADALLAYAGLSRCHLGTGGRGRSRRTAHIDHHLFDEWPEETLSALLDELSQLAPPLMRGGSHWAKEAIADAARRITVVLLDRGVLPDPERLWRWLAWMREGEGYDQQVKASMVQHLRRLDGLRRSVQAVALMQPFVEEIRRAEMQLFRIGTGLPPDADDVVSLLAVLRERMGEAPPEDLLLEIVALAPRRDGIAPSVLQAATLLADGRKRVLARLDELSRPIVDRNEARRKAELEREEEKRRRRHARARQVHHERRDAIRAGEGWALDQAAEVYLGRYAEFDKKDAPEVRLAKLLGVELAEEVLHGFMATLDRDDLPMPAQIADDDIRGREWLVARPLICGVAEMLRRAIPLSDATPAALEAAHMAWRRAGESNVVGGLDIGQSLEQFMFGDVAAAERFFRTSIEPQLEARAGHVRDLYKLSNEPEWRALSAKLAIEWLRRLPDLPPTIEVELLNQAVRHGEPDAVRRLLAADPPRVHPDHETMLSWLVADFLVRFDETREHLAHAAADDPAFLWFLRNAVGDDRRRAGVPLSIGQRAFVAEAFRSSWPLVNRPEGPLSGEMNPWDATAFIERMIYGIAGEPGPEATEALRSLLGTPSSYDESIRHALALQLRLRRDHEFRAVGPAQLADVVSSNLPVSVDDMRAFLADRIDRVREKMHATNTDMWEAYWDDERPRGENFCRNRLIEHISRELPEAVRFEPEMHMPDQKRADIAAIHGAVGLPVEIKGQWHRQIWEAPLDQLAARYARDWHAHGRGAYVVFWVGPVAGKELPHHPLALPRPSTPDELEDMLRDVLPAEWRDLIDVYVVDVSRPGRAA